MFKKQLKEIPLLENFAVGLFLVANGKFVYLNQAFAQTFGYKKSEIMNREKFSQVIPPEEQKIILKNAEQIEKDENASVIYNFNGNKKNGDCVFLECTGVSFMYEGETYFLSFLLGVTQKETDQRKKFLADGIFENNLIGILITDVHGSILSVNQAFSNITGYSINDVFGRNPKILKSGRHSNEFYAGMWEALSTKGEWQGEVWNKRKNQQIYLESLIIKAIKNDLDQTVLYLALLSDITYLREFEKNMRKELKLARQIQTNLLPIQLPQMPGLRFKTLYKPMEEVGGDFYDFVRLREQNLVGIFISDVSGHGVPAALITSMTKTLLDSAGSKKIAPGSLLKYMNDRLYGQTSDNFITAFYGIFDNINQQLTYSRSAHPLPILIRDGEFRELNGKANMMLAIFENLEYEEHKIQLQSKDKLIFYTDGLPDARNSKEQLFRPKFYEILKEHSQENIETLMEIIDRNLIKFCDRTSFNDDICIIGMEIE